MALMYLVLAFAQASFPAAAVRFSNEQSHTMVIRLLTPVASYSPVGTRFNAKVIGPQLREGFDFLPSDSIVTGTVVKSASVRLGLRHERAMLQLKFDECRLPDGTAIECNVALQEVDNAREKVSANRIEGVLVASRPSNWLCGLWYSPGTSLFSRAALGLTGAAGILYTRFAPTDLGAAAVIGSRVLFERLPDPEISFPAGTDLLVRVQVPENFTASQQPFVPLPPELSAWVAAQPEDVYLPDKKLAGDLIHLVFVGSREQVERAFLAAGWSVPEPLTTRSFERMYSAYLAMKADPIAPIAPLTYRGSVYTLAFQKTLNTVAKRHHIRIWPASFQGTQLWLAAATHDTSIALDAKHIRLTHRIDPYVDRERTTVLNDLASAGCIAQIGSVERPQAVRLSRRGRPSVTDGSAAVLFLGDCSAPAQPAASDLQAPHHRRFTLALRHFFLEDRQYLARDNAYYWTYRAAASLLRKKHPSASSDE